MARGNLYFLHDIFASSCRQGKRAAMPKSAVNRTCGEWLRRASRHTPAVKAEEVVSSGDLPVVSSRRPETMTETCRTPGPRHLPRFSLLVHHGDHAMAAKFAHHQAHFETNPDGPGGGQLGEGGRSLRVIWRVIDSPRPH